MPVTPPSLEADFQRFAADPGDVLAGALLVSRLIDPATDEAWCRCELARLATTVGPRATPEAVVETLRDAGFNGADDYYELRNSALQYVLNARRGIPISLAVVLMGVGESLGMAARGINFPGHFLVTLERQLIDPFALELLDEDECARRIEATGVPAKHALRPASSCDLVLRMLNNLRGLACAQSNPALALEYTDYQLLLTTETYALRLIRADLWHGLGAPRMAGIELNHALAEAPDQATRRQIELRLQQLADARSTLH